MPWACACPLHGLDRGLRVPQVVEGVEDAEDVHAVLDGKLAEPLDDVVGVVPVADDVLAAEKHLERRLQRFLIAQALP